MGAAQRGWFEFSGRWLCWRHLLSGAKASVAAGVYGPFPRNALTRGAFVCGVAAVDRSLQSDPAAFTFPSASSPASWVRRNSRSPPRCGRRSSRPFCDPQGRAPPGAHSITDPRGAKRVDDSDHIEATQRCAWKLRAQRCCTCGFIISSRTAHRGACHQKYWTPDVQVAAFALPLIAEVAAKAKPRGLRRRSPRDPPILMRLLPNLPIAVGQD
jgi:hypothetical protein